MGFDDLDLLSEVLFIFLVLLLVPGSFGWAPRVCVTLLSLILEASLAGFLFCLDLAGFFFCAGLAGFFLPAVVQFEDFLPGKI